MKIEFIQQLQTISEQNLGYAHQLMHAGMQTKCILECLWYARIN